jgi:hypothetical protein
MGVQLTTLLARRGYRGSVKESRTQLVAGGAALYARDGAGTSESDVDRT